MASTGGGCDDKQSEESHHGRKWGIHYHSTEPLGAGVARSGGHLFQLHLLDLRGHRGHEGEKWTWCRLEFLTSFCLHYIYMYTFMVHSLEKKKNYPVMLIQSNKPWL